MWGYWVIASAAAGWQVAQANLSFAAVGNWGDNRTEALESGKALVAIESREHFSFIVSPGFNFFGGISGPSDPRWQSVFYDVFTEPTGKLAMPFFTVLGTEDWMADVRSQIARQTTEYSTKPTAIVKPIEQEDGEGTDGAPTPTTAPYTAALQSPKWTIPNYWYSYVTHFTSQDGTSLLGSSKEVAACLYFLDTFVASPSFPFRHISDKCLSDFSKFLDLSRKVCDFIIVVGDRPIMRPFGSGDGPLKSQIYDLMKKAQVDLYLSGRDRTLEAIADEEILHVNTGSFGGGSTLTTLMASASDHTPSAFISGAAGMALVHLTGDSLTVRFYRSLDGALIKEIKRPAKTRAGRDKVAPYSAFSQMPPVVYVPLPDVDLPKGDVADFVSVVGTIGLAIAFAIAVLGSLTAVSRNMK